ncbi:MAG: TIGR03663 family protein, partial [Ardenticatenales bacterium]|nr:TIGR03663 family protein [Ardenticatenales bacterium]
FWGPRDVAVDDQGTVYVTDTGNKRIQAFGPEGEFLGQFGGPGAALGQLAEPVGIAVAPDGTIWVADTWNRRIQSFARDFDFTPQTELPLRAWSGQSITNKPYIEVSEDKIWVTDPEGFRIIELDHSGKVLRVWGLSADTSSLNLPFGLAFDGETLWVADSENHRIVGYTIE